MPKSIFFPGRGRDSNQKVSQTQRATTDKNDPFLNMGFKHGKKWVDKNGAKCNMGFGRITQKPIHCPSGGSPFADDSDTDSVNSHEAQLPPAHYSCRCS